MFYAGIDYSSRAVDVVKIAVDGAAPAEWHRFALSGQDAFDRTRKVRDAMPYRSEEFWDDVLGIGIEDPMAGNPKMRQTISVLKGIQGAILACLPPRTLVVPFNAKEWRVACGLPGNASKEDVSRWAHRQRIPADVVTAGEWPQDAHDAYCIALATMLKAQVVEALL